MSLSTRAATGAGVKRTMKYLNEEHMRDADSGEDTQESAYLLESRLAELRQRAGIR